MTTKLAIIHTTPVTVDSLKALAAELLPGVPVMNWVDDSILPQLAANGGNIGEIEDRFRQYALIAQRTGASCILSACSSIGELAARVQPHLDIPIVRIDEAMAEYAVNSAHTVGVAATLETTLQPTQRLISGKAEQAGKSVRIESVVAKSAYQKLLAGDKEGHDEELAAVLRNLAAKTDIVVLAQASMARVISQFAPEEQTKFLSSPRLGMLRVKQVIGQL
ncbi:aspartate/glutamate racemase family protein [Paenibacillus sp. GCM10023248]|uniref:aspartate/glutamate racemase family protein n=1 Tax=Bacillales TaxID=1385 RepID=UPI002378BF2C|nr:MULTISPECIES: aspartate/glutamate racemase family protein [Bacillales]MDD9267375.1 aspartate/glutamate racemase family protein [Paenibacillus sp. MAHUQ-63]MDR6882590.1 aspartate/glutamate racemase [Bacillus sp. 3255]